METRTTTSQSLVSLIPHRQMTAEVSCNRAALDLSTGAAAAVIGVSYDKTQLETNERSYRHHHSARLQRHGSHGLAVRADRVCDSEKLAGKPEMAERHETTNADRRRHLARHPNWRRAHCVIAGVSCDLSLGGGASCLFLLLLNCLHVEQIAPAGPDEARLH